MKLDVSYPYCPENGVLGSLLHAPIGGADSWHQELLLYVLRASFGRGTLRHFVGFDSWSRLSCYVTLQRKLDKCTVTSVFHAHKTFSTSLAQHKSSPPQPHLSLLWGHVAFPSIHMGVWGKKRSILLPIQLASKFRLSSVKGVGSEGELALEVT